MPLYEYECEACGVRFERMQSFSDAPLDTCPECGGHVHRVIYPVGIIFKGPGFYVTDNRAKSSTLSDNGTKREDKKTESTSKSESSKDSST
ncbi:MAG TPA: zinc ribbon domain-containing protein [Caldilineae bacterium]|nr:zinc ribbon domain-containing protein [Caldilineae bacterium]